MNNQKKLQLIKNFIAIFLLIIVDQITKKLAVTYLQGKEDIIIWQNVFHLRYLENKGAAFGMLQNQKIFFVCMATVVCVFLIYALVKIPMDKKFKMMEWIFVMIAAGAIGNMIDRIIHNYVIDFFYFILIDFPIFNVADIYVTCSTVLLIIAILWYYGENDFEFLKLSYGKNNR